MFKNAVRRAGAGMKVSEKCQTFQWKAATCDNLIWLLHNEIFQDKHMKYQLFTVSEPGRACAPVPSRGPKLKNVGQASERMRLSKFSVFRG
jgi:hypothetical protein